MMDNLTYKSHWENVYNTKSSNEVSWTQSIPKASLGFVQSFALLKNAKIIDIGGDSKFVDFMIEEGYENITVLDVSESALEKAKKRLKDKADIVSWICSDINDFEAETTYDIWHDRATFHFLTTESQISKYVQTASHCVNQYMVLGTFSMDGPTKCSGLDIRQYSEKTLDDTMEKYFEKVRCITENHTTPFNTIQNFLFCSFKKK